MGPIIKFLPLSMGNILIQSLSSLLLLTDPQKLGYLISYPQVIKRIGQKEKECLRQTLQHEQAAKVAYMRGKGRKLKKKCKNCRASTNKPAWCRKSMQRAVMGVHNDQESIAYGQSKETRRHTWQGLHRGRSMCLGKTFSRLCFYVPQGSGKALRLPRFWSNNF